MIDPPVSSSNVGGTSEILPDDQLPPARGLFAISAGPIAGVMAWGLLRLFLPEVGEPGCRAAGVLAWMAVWWLGEVLPLGITALLPLLLMPMLGILNTKEAAAPYADRVIFLFMGGFLLALAMEKWGLHRRIALVVMRAIGVGPRRLVLGVMAATSLISMWVSNTATTLLMLPIALGIVSMVEARVGKRDKGFALSMILGVAYAASVGGVATPIGSPPNAVLTSFLERTYGHAIGFGWWMLAAVPFVAVFTGVMWAFLVFVACPVRVGAIPGGQGMIRDELEKLGPTTFAQRGVMACFGLTVAGWVLREPALLLLEALDVDGAAAFIKGGLDDAAVSMIGGLLLFLMPAFRAGGRRDKLMNWATAKKLPWDILLLFGGGLCLAAGIQASGLDTTLGAKLSAIGGMPAWAVVLIAASISVFVSEFTSNVAQANVFYPILAGVAGGAGIDPMLLLFPCCIALSCAFMMPMGTPPNAIAFATGRVSIRQMAITGIGLNLLGIVLVVAFTLLVMTRVLGISLDGVPEWARRGAAPAVGTGLDAKGPSR